MLATVVLLSLGTLLAGVLAERIGSASGDQLLRERTAVLERSALASAGQLSDLRTQISELRQTVGTLEGRLGLLEPTTLEEVYGLFDRYLGRAPAGDAEAQGDGRVGRPYGEVLGEFLASPEAKQWREQGPKIQQTRRWVDAKWFELYGRAPTNDEVLGVIAGGYTPDTLEHYPRDRGATNVGDGQERATDGMANEPPVREGPR